MDEKFQKAEQAYFTLRGKLDAGRLTREEFEAALKQEMLQDDQGRYWILGLDSGKWYVHDGNDWVRGEPGSIATSLDQSAPSAIPAVAPAPPSAPNATTRKSNRLPIIAAVGCLAIICLLAIGGIAYVLLKPAAPRPTLAAVATTSGILLTTPTLGAIATPTREHIVDAVPTSTSEPTATPIPPTDTPNPIPTATTAPAFPPGLYITAMQTNPPRPIRRQDVFFDVRFVNTTGGSRSYRWLVYVYRPDQRNSLGETPSSPFTFPTGTGVAEIGAWRLTGAGGCEDFIARVAWLDDNKRPMLFTKPDGQVFEQPFTVCP